MIPNNPWNNLTPSPMGLCEATLDGWIRTPANTWSNLAFIAVGIFLLWRYRRDFEERRLLLFVPLSAILIGLCSFLYHASYSYELLVFDLFGMWVLLAFVLAINLDRLFSFTRWQFTAIAASVVVSSTVQMVWLKGSQLGPFLFILTYLLVIGLEAIIKRRQRDVASYRDFGLMLFMQILAAVAWLLDRQKIVCNPDSHIFQMHVLWHVFNAASLFFLYRHYRRVLLKDGAVQKAPVSL